MKKIDTNNIVFNKGYGYISSSKKICMIRCFDCGKENYSPMVASGVCAYCSYNPNTTSILNETTDITWEELKESVNEDRI